MQKMTIYSIILKQNYRAENSSLQHTAKPDICDCPTTFKEWTVMFRGLMLGPPSSHSLLFKCSSMCQNLRHIPYIKKKKILLSLLAADTYHYWASKYFHSWNQSSFPIWVLNTSIFFCLKCLSTPCFQIEHI